MGNRAYDKKKMERGAEVYKVGRVMRKKSKKIKKKKSHLKMS